MGKNYKKVDPLMDPKYNEFQNKFEDFDDKLNIIIGNLRISEIKSTGGDSLWKKFFGKRTNGN